MFSQDSIQLFSVATLVYVILLASNRPLARNAKNGPCESGERGVEYEDYQRPQRCV
jgi:hypothetical protein